MKAEIDQHGNLTIKAETTLEAYALSCWARDNIKRVVPDMERMTDGMYVTNLLINPNIDSTS